MKFRVFSGAPGYYTRTKRLNCQTERIYHFYSHLFYSFIDGWRLCTNKKWYSPPSMQPIWTQWIELKNHTSFNCGIKFDFVRFDFEAVIINAPIRFIAHSSLRFVGYVCIVVSTAVEIGKCPSGIKYKPWTWMTIGYGHMEHLIQLKYL